MSTQQPSNQELRTPRLAVRDGLGETIGIAQTAGSQIVQRFDALAATSVLATTSSEPGAADAIP